VNQFIDMPKLIKLYSGEPIGQDKTYRQPWSDVSVSFTGKPARKKYRFEPTLISRPSLERDIMIERHDLTTHPESDRSKLEHLENVLQLLQSGSEFHIVADGVDDPVPVIYSNSDYIDRSEAEKLLRHYLKTLGFDAVRYKWSRPGAIAYPI
jgi:hypothetical protein